jgi:V8-like Glu-specific endopeptidase
MDLIDRIRNRAATGRALTARPDRRAPTSRKLSAAVVVAIVAALAACSSAPSASGHGSPVGSASYWTRQRLLGAKALQESTPGPSSPSPSKSAHPAVLAGIRVGALFTSGSGGNHFCTASVVASPGRDLLITAAHCLSGGNGTGYRSDIVFVPDYRNGQAPLGIWTPKRLMVASGWLDSADPDLDVGFVVLEPHDGKNIQDILGANQLAVDSGYHNPVRVTGYPDSGDAPVTCHNVTTEHSPSQLQFDCDGYTGGTSGSPWVTGFDAQTRTGTIVGVLGGFQQGGDTPAISYSAYLGTAIQHLYAEAKGVTP